MATKVNKDLTPTPASVWRDMQVLGEIVKLPSGLVVKLRPVSMEKLYSSGKIPDGLTAIVASIVTTGGVSTGNEVQQILDAAEKMIELKRILCSASLVEPTVSDEPDYDAGQISYFDLSSEDSDYIMGWAQRPQKDLSTFRTE